MKLGTYLVGLQSLGLALAVACQSGAPSAATPATTAPAAAQPTKPQSSSPAPTVAPAATAAQPAPTAAAAPEKLKIGISAAMTGRAMRSGTNTERLIRLAIDDINSKGGVVVGGKTYVMDAVTVDDKGTSEGGVEAAQRLVLSERVKYVVGSFTSPSAGVQTVTEPNKVLLLGYAAPDKSLGTNYPLTFYVGVAHPSMRSVAIYEWLVTDHPEVKRVALLMTDDAVGRQTAALSEDLAKQKGLTVVAKEFYPLDQKDFGPLVSRVLRSNPDAIDSVAGAQGPLYIASMKAINEAGFKRTVYGVSADYGAMRDAAPFTNNFTTATLADWKASVVTAVERDAMQRLAQKYGEGEMEPLVVGAFASPSLLKQALEKAGTVEDTAKVAQVLRENEWDVPWAKEYGKSRIVGARTLGAAAVLEVPVYMSQVQDGKISTFKAIKATLP